VRADEVEHRGGRLLGVVLAHGAERAVELARGERDDLVAAAVVVVAPVELAAREAEHVLAEAVVHHRIELIAREPLAGVGPDFADERPVRLVAFGERPVLVPPVVRDFVRHVEAPARGAALVPVLRHVRARRAVEEVTYRA
jgi:hypothetical protein